MEQTFIKLLDENLECVNYKFINDKFVLFAKSNKTEVKCLFYGSVSSKIHSIYQREIQDIPMQDKQTILLLNIRKMFCLNDNCTHRTFSERFDFVAPNGKKTKRLINKILITSTKLSSVTASALLENSSIKACKSSICDLLKKCRLLWINPVSQKYVWMTSLSAKDIHTEQLWLTLRPTELLISLILVKANRLRSGSKLIRCC